MLCCEGLEYELAGIVSVSLNDQNDQSGSL
jgi:hypothetical protein